MKTRNLYILLLSGLLLFAVTSCEDKINNWAVDDSYNQLFRPTTFTRTGLMPTSVQLQFGGVIDAVKYVIEFSEDSLLFHQIVRTVELEADTLTPYEDATAVVEKRYRNWFEDLKGTTRYSVRIKAIGADKESGYSQLTFVTPNEQIFIEILPLLEAVTFTWEPELAVTEIMYRATNSEEIHFPLNETHIAEGKATITGLTPGTAYYAQIMNNEAIRGRANFTPLGIPGGEGINIHLLDTIKGTDIREILMECIDNGNTKVALIFEGNKVYDFIDRITIPEGIESLYFIGGVTLGQTIPELFLNRIAMDAPINNIRFEKVDINARLNSSNYIFDMGSTNGFKTIDFEGCTIRNVARSIVRPNNAGLDIEHIRFNNCILHTVGAGGYGCINMGVDVPVGLISFTNTTVIEFGTDRMLHLKGGVQRVVVDKVTFCNYKVKATQVFRFDTAPESMVRVTNCIFTGTNAGTNLQAGNSVNDPNYLIFEDCYITADLPLAESRPFTGATVLTLTSEELFVDPQNGDFHTKRSYQGSGKAGDPRWW